jgi:hypothetical protein
MKVVLALLGGAALGIAAVRLRSSRGALGAAGAPPAVAAGSADAGPERVAVDVSAFAG